MGEKYLYRGKPVLDYKLAASRVLIGKTALARLPGFIKDACELADHDGKPHLLRDEFEPFLKNHNDYLRLSCQLGLIDNVRAGRTTEYFLNDFAKKISADATTDSARIIIRDCVWYVVKSGKETLPQERHAVLLLWYVLKLRSEGIDPSEEYFDRGGEKNYTDLYETPVPVKYSEIGSISH